MKELNTWQQKKLHNQIKLDGKRYRKGSYKARKAGIEPIRMLAKWTPDDIALKIGLRKETVRVYGDANEPVTPKQQSFATQAFKSLKSKERAWQHYVDQATPGRQKRNRHEVSAG